MIDSFPHQWTEDTRSPVLSWEYGDQTFGLFAPSLPSWIELLGLIILEALAASLYGVLVYHVVVKRKANLFAYGVLVPLWLLLPPFLLQSIPNKIFRFCLTVITPICSLFRTTATIHGFAPTTESASQLALYFGSPMRLQSDDKRHVKATLVDTLGHLGRFVGLLCITGFFYSLFGLLPQFPMVHQPPPDRYERLLDWHTVLDPVNLRHSALFALFFQLYLMTFGEGLMFATCAVTRCRPEPLMDNPMLASTSPSDFWGRRWNLIIHDCLKQGVYKPCRQMGGGPTVAALAAFVASGLFHEWLLPIVFFDESPVYGTTLLFFAWQAMLVAIETCMPQIKVHWIPRPVRTALVIASGIPLAHWFCDTYVHSDFFVQGSMLFFTFRPL